MEQCVCTHKGTNGDKWSILSCLGIVVWSHMIARNNDLWKEVRKKMHSARDEKAPMAPIHHIFALGTIPHEQLTNQ